MYLRSAVRLTGPWTLNLVTSVSWAQVGSGEPLILVQGARACFMAVERCAKKMNRARLEKRSRKPESEIWAFLSHMVLWRLLS